MVFNMSHSHLAPQSVSAIHLREDAAEANGDMLSPSDGYNLDLVAAVETEACDDTAHVLEAPSGDSDAALGRPVTNSSLQTSSTAPSSNEYGFIRSGHLWKQGDKGVFKAWSKRYFTLDHNEMKYYKGKTEFSGDMPPKGTIDLSTIILTPMGYCKRNPHKKEWCFEFTAVSGRTYYLSAAKEVRMKRWMRDIEEAVKNRHKALLDSSPAREGGVDDYSSSDGSDDYIFDDDDLL